MNTSRLISALAALLLLGGCIAPPPHITNLPQLTREQAKAVIQSFGGLGGPMVFTGEVHEENSLISLEGVEGDQLLTKINFSDFTHTERHRNTTGSFKTTEFQFSGRGELRKLDLKKIVRIETTGPRQTGGMAVLRLRGEPRPGQTVNTLLMTLSFDGKKGEAWPLDQARQMTAALHTLCPNAVMN